MAAKWRRHHGFEWVDHPPYSPDFGTIFLRLYSNMKEHLAGKQYRSNGEVISAIGDFFEDQDESSIPRESKRCNIDGRSVGEAMLKNKPHLVKFDHCIIVNL